MTQSRAVDVTIH